MAGPIFSEHVRRMLSDVLPLLKRYHGTYAIGGAWP